MFNQLVNDYSLRLFNVAVGRRGKYMSVDEAKQIVLLELWKYSLDPQEVRNLGAFLNKVIQRRVLNATRPDRRYYEMNEEVEEDYGLSVDPQDIESDYISAQEMEIRRARIAEALPLIPEELRESLSLRLNGLSYKSISKCTGLPTPIVGNRIRDGKAKLNQEVMR